MREPTISQTSELENNLRGNRLIPLWIRSSPCIPCGDFLEFTQWVSSWPGPGTGEPWFPLFLPPVRCSESLCPGSKATWWLKTVTAAASVKAHRLLPGLAQAVCVQACLLALGVASQTSQQVFIQFYSETERERRSHLQWLRIQVGCTNLGHFFLQHKPQRAKSIFYY